MDPGDIMLSEITVTEGQKVHYSTLHGTKNSQTHRIRWNGAGPDGPSPACPPSALCLWKSFSPVQFSRSVVSDSLQPHESQHTRPPCPWPSPRVHSDSHPSSWWCHPAISSSVIPSSSCPQSLLASESFPMSQLFAWGGQSAGVSASASFPPKKSQGSSIVGCKKSWMQNVHSIRQIKVKRMLVSKENTHRPKLRQKVRDQKLSERTD